MKLRYYIERVYGEDKRYPVDAEISMALTNFNGHKTLTDNDLHAFEILGYEPEVVINPSHLTPKP